MNLDELHGVLISCNFFFKLQIIGMHPGACAGGGRFFLPPPQQAQDVKRRNITVARSHLGFQDNLRKKSSKYQKFFKVILVFLRGLGRKYFSIRTNSEHNSSTKRYFLKLLLNYLHNFWPPGNSEQHLLTNFLLIAA